MRVTEGIIYRSAVKNLGRLNSDVQKLNEQISSGKRLVQPSEDPVAAVSAQGVRGKLAALAQQKRNVDAWKGWLQSTENAMTAAQTVVSRARELAVQMSNATYSQAQRQSAAEEVNNLLEQMVSLGNTEYEGRYVFSGFRDDTAAFDVTRVGGEITAVTYTGDDGHHELKLGPSSRLEASLTGEETFQTGGNLFSTLIGLRDALRANDAGAVANTLTDLTNATSSLSALVADVGSKVNRLDLRLTLIEDTTQADTERLSELEDADLVAAVSALQNKELAYEAALKATASIQGLNLASYL